MGLRPTKDDEDESGADPLVRAGPPGPALRASSISHQADEGVGCGPGGPSHFVFKGAPPRNHSARFLAIAVR
jgi:hypothetical protein